MPLGAPSPNPARTAAEGYLWSVEDVPCGYAFPFGRSLRDQADLFRQALLAPIKETGLEKNGLKKA